MDGGLVYESEEMRSVLSYPALVDHLNDAFASASRYSVPDRHHHDILDPKGDLKTTGTLLLMPAWSDTVENDEKRYMGVKLVTVFPSNVERGLSSVFGLYVLSCGKTGKPLALMNGTELTLWRTACVSALAARYLAKQNPLVLTMVGAGAMAPHLIQAHLAIRPSISKILVWNRTHARAVQLADTLRKLRCMDFREVEAYTNLESSIGASDIVSCATMSEAPLVQGQWLRPGCHLDLVGGYKPAMRECDDEAVRISRLFVDTSAAISEAGDLQGPIRGGVILPNAVLGDLADLAGGKKAGRQNEVEITLFKSVGCALEDLAAAQFIYEKMTNHS